MEVEVWETLSEMELVLPHSEFVWSLHVTGHVVNYIRDFGPARDWWAFPLEGFLGHLKTHGKYDSNHLDD